MYTQKYRFDKVINMGRYRSPFLCCTEFLRIDNTFWKIAILFSSYDWALNHFAIFMSQKKKKIQIEASKINIKVNEALKQKNKKERKSAVGWKKYRKWMALTLKRNYQTWYYKALETETKKKNFFSFRLVIEFYPQTVSFDPKMSFLSQFSSSIIWINLSFFFLENFYLIVLKLLNRMISLFFFRFFLFLSTLFLHILDLKSSDVVATGNWHQHRLNLNLFQGSQVKSLIRFIYLFIYLENVP